MITFKQAKQLRNGDKVKVGELEFQITGSVSTDDRITVQMQNERVGASFFTQDDLAVIDLVTPVSAAKDEPTEEPADAGSDEAQEPPKPKAKKKLQ